jgi:hypothetical protein
MPRANSTYLQWDLDSSLSNVEGAIHEWLGLIAYRLTGKTAEWFPHGCVASD